MTQPTNTPAQAIRRIGVALLILWAVLLEIAVFMWSTNKEAPTLLTTSSFIALVFGAAFLVVARVVEKRADN